MHLMFFIWLIFAYLFGSINNAVIVSNFFHKQDVRNFGSKNAGSTNALRTYGKGTGALVFLLDVIKPIIPMSLGLYFSPTAFQSVPGGLAWVGLMSIVGQCYPLYFGFRGGKGAASTVGVMLMLLPLTIPFVALCFFTLLFTLNMVSFATMITFSLNIIFVFWLYPQYALPYFLIVCLVVWRHRPNIQRIRNHTEPRLRDSLKRQKEKRSSSD